MRTFGARVVGVVVLLVAAQALAAEKPPPKAVVDLAPALAAYGKEAVFVSAVKARNAKGETLEQAKALQKKWAATQGMDDFMKSIQNGPAGDRLREIVKSKPYFIEAYLMDKNGSNVSMAAKTSNYWRGDKPKFTEAYKGGKGGTYVSPVYFDDSAQVYESQISVPVMDGGKCIGVLTLGVDVAKL
ncbi:MAG: cache domain-containing protein [Myxococcales bacterium]